MLFLSFQMVFSKWPYLAITGAITGLFWVIFNVFNELPFFSPIVTFYLPEDAIVDFILSSITAVLMGGTCKHECICIKAFKKFEGEYWFIPFRVNSEHCFKHMCHLFIIGLCSCFYIWRNRGGDCVSLSIQLSDTFANSFDSPFGMGIIFTK